MRCTASACELAAIIEISYLQSLACGALLLPVSSRTFIACFVVLLPGTSHVTQCTFAAQRHHPSHASMLLLPRLAAAGTARATRHARQYQQGQRELVCSQHLQPAVLGQLLPAACTKLPPAPSELAIGRSAGPSVPC